MKGVRASILCCVMACAVARSAFAAPEVELAQSSVIVQKTRLWSEPTRYGEPTAALEPGLKVKVLDYSTGQDWIQVRTPAGREGWIKVRATTLGGRRTDDPLISSQQTAEADKPRDPASNGARDALATDPDAVPAASDYSAAMPAGGPPVVRKQETIDGEIDELPEEAASAKASAASRRGRHAEASAAASAKSGKKTLRAGGEPEPARRSLSVSLEYAHQLSPESMPGFALRPSFFWRMGQGDFWLGGGFDYMFFFRGLSDSSATVRAKTERSIHRFVPQGLARYRRGPFQVDAGLGLDLQRTSVTTSDLDTGATITTNPAGAKVSGTAFDTGIAFRLAPAYLFPLSNGSSLGVSLSYVLSRYLSSGDGSAAGGTTSGWQHVLGGGIAYRKDL